MSPATPYYDHDGITIYCGDSREVIPQLDLSGWRPLVIADVPYGIDLKPHKRRKNPISLDPKGKPVFVTTNYPALYGDAEPFDPRWLLDIGAARIIWGANHFASKLPDQGGWLVWDKLRGDDLDQATCELAWTDCVKGVRRFVHLWDGMRRASEQGTRKLVHPTQKPVALMAWCMSLRWTKDYTDIIDPYMGSGPVMRAAKDLEKRAIGIEIVEEYCKRAVERLRQQTFSFAAVSG